MREQGGVGHGPGGRGMADVKLEVATLTENMSLEARSPKAKQQNVSKRQAHNTVKLGPHTISSRCGPTLANSDNCTGLLLESRSPRLDRGLPLLFADGAVGGLRAIEIDPAATLDDVFRPAACNLATPCSLACNLAARQPAQPYSLQIAAA
jgi:hypothetical protein